MYSFPFHYEEFVIINEEKRLSRKQKEFIKPAEYLNISTYARWI